MTDLDDGVLCPAGVPVGRWARAQALAACVPGAPGWFAVPAGGEVGAVNLRAVPAVFTVQAQEDGCYRVVATVDRGGWELEGGPYADEYEAGRGVPGDAGAGLRRRPVAGGRAGRVSGWRPPPDEGGPGERWGWPWALAGLAVISMWLTVCGVWWFGLAPS